MNPRHQEHLNQFKDSLVGQYKELIHEAIIECQSEYKTRLDIGTLNAKLKMITKSALHDGLEEEAINELIERMTIEQLPVAA